MRLTNGYYGKLMIKMHGNEGTVCRDGWDDTDADVLCRSLGYVGGIELGTFTEYSLSDPIWLTNIQCTGNETSLNQCSVETDVDSTCIRDLSPAGAMCFTSSTGENKKIDENTLIFSYFSVLLSYIEEQWL